MYESQSSETISILKLATVSVGDWGHLKLWARQYAYIFIIQYIDYILINIYRLFTFDSSLNLVRSINFEGIFVYCMT
jgi:hypothetical protein